MNFIFNQMKFIFSCCNRLLVVQCEKDPLVVGTRNSDSVSATGKTQNLIFHHTSINPRIQISSGNP